MKISDAIEDNPCDVLENAFDSQMILLHDWEIVNTSYDISSTSFPICLSM